MRLAWHSSGTYSKILKDGGSSKGSFCVYVCAVSMYVFMYLYVCILCVYMCKVLCYMHEYMFIYRVIINLKMEGRQKVLFACTTVWALKHILSYTRINTDM